MKTYIEVKDRKEAKQIKLGLQDEAVRAFVRVMGVLSTLPTQRARQRVMRYVEDQFNEQQENRHRTGDGEATRARTDVGDPPQSS